MKRILALVLSICLVLSVLPANFVWATEQTQTNTSTEEPTQETEQAQSTEPSQQPETTQSETLNADVCHCANESCTAHQEGTVWAAWGDDEAEKNTLPTTLPDGVAGYYLTEAVKPTAGITVEGQVKLCLNGYSIDLSQVPELEAPIVLKGSADLTIMDCKNTGKLSSGYGTHAGAIYVKGGSLKLYGVTLEGNSAKHQAGAVDIYKATTVDIRNVTFRGNSAPGKRAGAIYCNGTSSTSYQVNIEDTVFENNSANMGGAIYVANYANTLTLKNCSFSGNTATSNGNDIYVADSKATITVSGNSSISEIVLDKSAKLTVGALGSAADICVKTATTMEPSSFMAAASDAAIPSNAKLIYKNNGQRICYQAAQGFYFGHVHSSCSCGLSGASACTPACQEQEWQPWESTTALPTTMPDGVAGYYLTDTVKPTAGTTVEGQVKLCLNGYSIDLSQVPELEAPIILNGSADLTIMDCQNAGKLLGGYGTHAGAIYVKNGSLKLYGVTLENNSALYQAGAVDIYKATTVDIRKVTFRGNSAPGKRAGAIYCNGTSTTSYQVNIEDTVFENNSANMGGAIYMANYANTLTLKNCSFSGNTATSNGNDIYVADSKATITVSGNSSISDLVLDKSAKLTVGALGSAADICVKTATTMETPSFMAAAADVAVPSGAALTYKNNGLKIYYEAERGFYFGHNHAACSCGVDGAEACDPACQAQEWQPWESTTTLPTTMPDGVAGYYLTETVKPTAGTTIEGQVKLCLNGYSIDLSEVPELEAPIILNGSADLTIMDCQNTGKLLGGYGTHAGAIYVKNGSLKLYGVTLENNSALYQAGAVCIYKATTVDIRKVTFSGNSAPGKRAGAIYCNGTSSTSYQVNIEDTVFENNSANMGGAIYMVSYANTLTLKNCTFSGNTATDSGNDIYVADSNATITVSGNSSISEIFLNNNAKLTVGALTTGSSIGVKTTSEKVTPDFMAAASDVAVPSDVVLTYKNNGLRIYYATERGFYFEYNHNHAACGCGVDGAEACDPACQTLQWQPWESTTTLPTTMPDGVAGYYLTDTVKPTAGTTVEGQVKLCLNGNSIDLSQVPELEAPIILNGSADLTIMDCQNAGKLSGGYGTHAGAIYVKNGSLKLYGVTLENNSALYQAGAVCIYKATTVDIRKVTFRGNSAPGKRAGAIYCNGTSSTSYQVNIEDTVFENNSANMGGAIYMVSYSNTLTLKNCTFSGNTATSSGNDIYVADSDATITVSGNSSISEIYLNNNAKLTVGALTTGSSIGVKTASERVTPDFMAAASDVAVPSDAVLTYKNNGLRIYYSAERGFYFEILTPHTDHWDCSCALTNGASCQGHSGETPVWKPWVYTDRLPTATGNYYLVADVIVTNGQNKVESGAVVKLCLNGMSIDLSQNQSSKEFANYYVDAGASLTIMDCQAQLTEAGSLVSSGSIKGGHGTYGGAIYAKGTLYLLGVTFEENEAKAGANGIGGAVRIQQGGTATVQHSKFINNKATVDGGAIATYKGGTLTVTDTLFQGNTADSLGGAICTSGKSTVSLERVQIQSGSAKHGGAILLQSAGSTLALENVDILNNTASGNGGGIYISKKTTLTAGDICVSGNTATKNGAGIYADETTLILSKGEIRNNQAGTNGGGLYVVNSTITLEKDVQVNENQAVEGGGLYLNKSTLTTTGGHISGNSAAYGAGMMITEKSKVTLSGGEVKENTASKVGGGVYLQKGGSLEIAGGSILKNTAGGNGGGIFADSTDPNNQWPDITFKMSAGEVKENTAGAEGGGLCLKVSEAELTGGSITGNKAGTNGGGISTVGKCKLTLKGVEVSYNTAQKQGGGISLTEAQGDAGSGVELTIAGSLITNNSSTGNGGGIFASTNSVITFTGGKLANNETQASGGGIYGKSTAITLTQGSIQGNKAIGNGGGMSVITSTITLEKEFVVSGNKSAEGGGLYLNNASTLTMTGGYFYRNTANYGAGVMVSEESKAQLKGGEVKENAASRNGGGMYLQKGSSLENTGCSILRNTAEGSGGGIYADSTDANNQWPDVMLKMSNGGVKYNTAGAEGGGICLKLSEAEFSGGIITGNKAGSNGGGISTIGKSKLTIKGGEISYNTAEKLGGGIILAEVEGNAGCGAELTITDGIIRYNTSKNNGGGIYASSNSVLKMTGGEISYNKTEKNGGGIYAKSMTMDLSGGKIRKNSAKQGGGISVAKVTINFSKNASITENTVTDSGGGVFLNSNSVMKMTGGKISNNKAPYGGGLRLSERSTLRMSGGTVKANQATKNGGAMYVFSGAKLILSGGSIADNKAANFGGGVCADSTDTNDRWPDVQVTMTGGTISGNKATTKEGGGMYIKLSTADLQGGVFQGNHAGTNGGAISTAGKATINIDGTEFTENTSVKNAGAILLQGKDSVLNLESGTFSKNESVQAGALYVSKNTTFNMNGGTFTKNRATGKGGAMYLLECVANLNEGSFEENWASGFGAGFYSTKAEVNIQNISVVKNVTETSGGGIYAQFGYFTMNGGTISDNEAVIKGGGLALCGNGTIAGGKITNNKVVGNEKNPEPVGGGVAILVDDSLSVKMTGGEISNNYSAGHGGGINVHGNTVLHMSGGRVVNNTAKLNGGGIGFCFEPTLRKDQCVSSVTGDAVVSGNSAQNGGGIYVGKTAFLTVDGATVENNTASEVGGALYFIRGSMGALKNTKISGNEAGKNGGAFYCADDLTMHNLEVSGNTTGEEGYAVYLEENYYDGESYITSLVKISGDMRICDNTGSEYDMFVGKEGIICIGSEGLGENTKIYLELESGLLTDTLFGVYNYEGGDCKYLVTYGDRSVMDPEVRPDAQTEEDESDSTNKGVVLYAVIAGVVVVGVLWILLLLIKKKKKTQEDQVAKKG